MIYLVLYPKISSMKLCEGFTRRGTISSCHGMKVLKDEVSMTINVTLNQSTVAL